MSTPPKLQTAITIERESGFCEQRNADDEIEQKQQQQQQQQHHRPAAVWQHNPLFFEVCSTFAVEQPPGDAVFEPEFGY
jgi:hypothetical protein